MLSALYSYYSVLSLINLKSLLRYLLILCKFFCYIDGCSIENTSLLFWIDFNAEDAVAMTERISVREQNRRMREAESATTFTFTSVRRPGCSARSIHEFHFHGHGRATTFSHSLWVSRRECAEMLSTNIDICHAIRTL